MPNHTKIWIMIQRKYLPAKNNERKTGFECEWILS